MFRIFKKKNTEEVNQLTDVSDKWKDYASQGGIGAKEGMICEWCECVRGEDGKYFCNNPSSIFHDERIQGRGTKLPIQCGVFKVSEYYKSDDTYNELFDEYGK